MAGPSTVQILNPDNYLQTENGRHWTPERSNAAWNNCFDMLTRILSQHSLHLHVVLVCGLQGSGKSTWISRQLPIVDKIVYFDAALPAARHRKPIVDIAKAAHAPIEAVWIDVPLEVALKRNALRPLDLQVPEASIRSVAKLFEAPSTDEGFEKVAIVRNL